MSSSRKLKFTPFDMSQLASFELLKQGAEAKVYLGTLSTTLSDHSGPVIVKERFKKTYRVAELDKSLTAKRIKNEMKLLTRAESLGIRVPKVLLGDLEKGVIVMEYVANSLTCREFILNLVKEEQDDAEKLTKTLDELATRVGKVIGKLHAHDVVHGDLTTSNVLVVPSSNSEQRTNIAEAQVYFIDFGLAFVSHLAEDKAVDLFVLERALLSTHSQQAERFFARILDGYRSEKAIDTEKCIEKLEQVRLRGRKRTMIG